MNRMTVDGRTVRRSVLLGFVLAALAVFGALLAVVPWFYAHQVPRDPITTARTTTTGFHVFHHSSAGILATGAAFALIFVVLCAIAFAIVLEAWDEV